MALPAVKLPACTSVTLFLDAEGGDTVALSRLVFYGSEAAGGADLGKMRAG